MFLQTLACVTDAGVFLQTSESFAKADMSWQGAHNGNATTYLQLTEAG